MAAWVDCLNSQGQDRKPLRRINLVNQACRQHQVLHMHLFVFALHDDFDPSPPLFVGRLAKILGYETSKEKPIMAAHNSAPMPGDTDAAVLPSVARPPHQRWRAWRIAQALAPSSLAALPRRSLQSLERGAAERADLLVTICDSDRPDVAAAVRCRSCDPPARVARESAPIGSKARLDPAE